MISNILFGAIVVSDSLNTNQAKQDDNFFLNFEEEKLPILLKGKRWWLKMVEYWTSHLKTLGLVPPR